MNILRLEAAGCKRDYSPHRGDPGMASTQELLRIPPQHKVWKSGWQPCPEGGDKNY